MTNLEQTKILVASCDKNQDTFEPFHHCWEKYWPNHPEIIYSTETLLNPYYKTINKNYDINLWTKRIRETVQEIDSKFILLVCDDIFLRKNVNIQDIESKLDLLINNIGALHLERQFDSFDTPYYNGTILRNISGKYQTAVCCGIWTKEALLTCFNVPDIDPWQFEKLNKTFGYRFLITKNGLLDWGYYKPDGKKQWFGLQKGKWCIETKHFFEAEGIKIDYDKRGLVDGEFR